MKSVKLQKHLFGQAGLTDTEISHYKYSNYEQASIAKDWALHRHIETISSIN